MTIRSLLAASILFSLTVANAQTTTSGGGAGSSPGMDTPVQVPAAQPTTTNVSNATGTNQISAPFRIQAPQIGDFKLKAGIKSQNTSARAYDYDDAKGARAKQKHEYYLGSVHASGWGLYGQAVTSGTIYSDSAKTTVMGGDPSVTLLHPDFYRGTSLTLAGQFRRYFGITDRSVDRGQKQWAYYLYTTYQLPRQWSIFNQNRRSLLRTVVLQAKRY